MATTAPPLYPQSSVYQRPAPIVPAMPVAVPNPPRAPLPTCVQALHSTYASRLRTGVSLLVQPIFASTSTSNLTRATRRGGVINYADPGSGDDIPDAGALDTDDSDFVASGGTRTSIRQSRNRSNVSMNVYNAVTGASTPRAGAASPRLQKSEVDQSYLGLVPPARFIKSRVMPPTAHEYPPPDVMEHHARNRTSLVPIRVEFETETHRIRDCFTWNINETLIKPENFAKIFCDDLDIPSAVWADTVAAQIRAQLEDHEGVATMELGQDGALDVDAAPPNGEQLPECRVILSIDVQIANHHLMDHIEWDLLSPLTPEAFSIKLCAELGLTGEAVPLVAHAVHEELMKHKKDAIEWGVIGGDRDERGEEPAATGEKRDRSGFGLMKDKTGLGLGWGRAPRDGRGPKTLKSVWRDWAEAEEFKTTFEELTAEEIERRENERERATRRLRRETSKFQSSVRSHRRR
ncbi:Chromatin structure-remodeling complex subunit sfh1 [Psilocybe cubensis]|uniref:SNF5-domain-containing protein n=2 Tax=Psilocybe cubensis TaxID=181762 RepID=A0A8H7XPX6_PSICU|nr:Chromatin structure-remodeling complex subunit sfh1 [Psilocybe cubensis]KAH9480637.1 Chromatin structure-remodeling complex subunit sfh1 [Psilocybe cubensis]